MKIVVYDVAARDGGGLLVLKEFWEDAKKYAKDNVEWVFIVSQDILQETPNIHVILIPQAAQSWAKRIWFESIRLPQILRHIKPDLVISLQNMAIRGCSYRQFVYLHQSLQFCPRRFSVLVKEERGLAVRQHIIGRLIRNAMWKAEHIFVQTKWIKDATAKWLGRCAEQITVVPVVLEKKEIINKYYNPREENVFFYPARGEIYKNHEIIIKACQVLKRQGITDYRVLLTLSKDDSLYTNRLIRLSADLPIEFIGHVPYEKIWDYYTSTVLIFPSYLETCGLPLIESKLVCGRILASDTPFSHEALDGYPNADFFPYEDAEYLAEKMRELIKGKPHFWIEGKIQEKQSLVEAMLKKAWE